MLFSIKNSLGLSTKMLKNLHTKFPLQNPTSLIVEGGIPLEWLKGDEFHFINMMLNLPELPEDPNKIYMLKTILNRVKHLNYIKKKFGDEEALKAFSNTIIKKSLRKRDINESLNSSKQSKKLDFRNSIRDKRLYSEVVIGKSDYQLRNNNIISVK